MVFLDDADAPGALAYHDLTPDGFPISKVFVKTTLKSKELVSVSASHELVEMLVDPAINLWANGPDADQMWAYESADPVEADSFDVGGFAMSDFVFPAWFEGFRRPKPLRRRAGMIDLREFSIIGIVPVIMRSRRDVQIGLGSAHNTAFHEQVQSLKS